ncbi:MAG: ferredoxin:glutaredoxin reductase [Thermoplasmata archaeon]|nr:MAG: ferredoxin:glutaredoxin reductase [Thermoplasmata archaeon]
MTKIDEFFDKLKKETEDGGYLLNPDKEFVYDLIEGLLTNTERYGYQSCPCRLAFGEKEKDLDIICPCDYRDPDLNDFGTCYCALYVNSDWIEGKIKQGSIPDRRLQEKERRSKPSASTAEKVGVSGLKLPVWRCKVCGYLSARENPPDVCPICKAKKERFELFIEAG